MRTTEYPVYTTGSWQPFPGEEHASLAAWREFAGWAAGLEGAGEGFPARDVRAEGRYVSLIAWDGMESVRGWKGHPAFKERLSRVQQLVDKFAPTEIEVVARPDRDA